MKNKNLLILAVGMIILFGIINVLGEVYLWDDVIRNNATQTLDFHAFYQFQDTSVTGVNANQDTRVIFALHVEPLPVVLLNVSLGEVDWCNFTLQHFRNSSLFETISYYFANSSLNNTMVTILMRDRDSVEADMRCYYNNTDGLYAEGTFTPAGDFNTYMSSYQCTQCLDFSLEQLSNEEQRNENITNNSVGIYNNIQQVVGFNYQIWLIISWVLKIGFIFVALGLIFAGVYYFYVFFSNIGKELNR